MSDYPPLGLESPNLLTHLDAIVRGDGAPSGLVGTVCVGVCGAVQDTFWTVTLGAGPCSTEFSARCPQGVDALLFMSQTEADGLDSGVPLDERLGAPTSEIGTVGDAALLTSFVQRYLGQLSPLALQTTIFNRGEVGHA